MRYQRSDCGHERIATFDIETTHWKASKGETVSVGIAVHDRGEPADNITYKTFNRGDLDDEGDLITHAIEFIETCGADVLVSYNGRDFDLEFLKHRLYRLAENNVLRNVDLFETHVDLLEDRKVKCEKTGRKWPKLEECLASYSLPEPETIWGGKPMTNTRFGEELGPAYIEAITVGDEDRTNELCAVIDHYLCTDLEANLAVYYADIGTDFQPAKLGSQAVF